MIMSLSFELDEAEQKFLGRQARLSIETALNGEMAARPLQPTPENVGGENVKTGQSPLEKPLGSFVTLSLNGALRGCIGTIIGREPLYLNVWNMARQAAFHDPRFPPITRQEWPQASMEISVLDQPSRCPDPAEIVIGRDGLILQYMGRSGVFLPQVPVEQGWNLEQYLNHLCLKAGVPQGSWQKPGSDLFWYQAQVFPICLND